jgi:hypothetical protein
MSSSAKGGRAGAIGLEPLATNLVNPCKDGRLMWSLGTYFRVQTRST